MATTENSFNGTGSQDSFSFTFPYLKDTDIKVSVGGVVKTVTTHYTLHTPTTIKFTSGDENTGRYALFVQDRSKLNVKDLKTFPKQDRAISSKHGIRQQ